MSLTRDCPSCARVNLAKARACEGCGLDFATGRPGPPARLKGGEPRLGVFALALGTIVAPVHTMDSFFYYVSDSSMLRKMVIFYLVSLPIAGFIAGGGEASHWVQGTVAEAVGFAVSTICIVVAGRLLAMPGSLVGAGVILGFVRAVVSLVLGVYALAIVTGVLEPNFFVYFSFLIWNLVLNIVALTNIFGCSAMVAIFISMVGGSLNWVVTRFVGLS